MSLRDEIAASVAVILAITPTQVHDRCATSEETADQTGGQLIHGQAREGVPA